MARLDGTKEMSKDAYYFRHDSNSSNDPKMIALLMRYGMAGYGKFWRLIEILRDQSDYRLPNSPLSISALAKAWICTAEEAIDFAKSLEVDYELIRSDDNFIWSDSLCRRMGVLDSVKSVRSELGKKGAKKRWDGSAIKNDSKGIGSAIRKNGSAIGKNSPTKQNDGNVFIDSLLAIEPPPLKGAAPIATSEPQEKDVATKVDDLHAHCDYCGADGAHTTSCNRPGNPNGLDPPASPADNFDDDFPGAT